MRNQRKTRNTFCVSAHSAVPREIPGEICEQSVGTERTTCGSRRSPTRKSSTRATRSSRSRRRRSAALTCTSTTATSRPWRRATSSAMSSWARSSRSGRECKNLKVGDRVVVPFTIACGRCFFCQKAALVALRQLESERRRWPKALRLLGRRACSATRTCSADTPAARPSTCACRSPTSARSRCPTG